MVNPINESQTVNVTAYKYQAVKVGPSTFVNTPTEYFIETYNHLNFLLGQRTHKFKIGPNLTVGNQYRITFNSVTQSYTVLTGNTVANVLSGVASVISGMGFASVTTDGVNTLTVVINDIVLQATASLYHPGAAIFQAGFYIPSSTLPSPTEWLISGSEQAGSYPPVGVLAASYNFSALTPLPSGLSNYLFISGYTPLALFSTVEGTTDITSVPGTSISINGNELGYDAVHNVIIAPISSPFGVGERVNLFYK